MLLLSVIIEYFSVNEVRQYYEALNKIIETHLQSDHSSLKTLAVETVTQFVSSIKNVKILRKYSNLIPLVLRALDEDNEELIQKVFDTFNEFVEIKKVLKPHLSVLVHGALQVASNSRYNLNLREVTMLFLEMIADNYSGHLTRNKALLEDIIKHIFRIASEDEEEYD